MKTFREFVLNENLKKIDPEKFGIPKEKRTLKNLPRYANGKPKIHFQTWLEIKRNGSKGCDGKYYGWSHRAIHGFGVGDTVKPGDIAFKGKNKPYKIKTEKEAKEHALFFAKEVS